MKRNAALLVLSSAASALELSGHCGGRRAIVSAGLAAVTSSAPLAAIAASRENLDSVSTQTPLPAEAPSGEQQFVTLPSGLKYKEIKKGSGDVVRQGDTVAIQYTGRLLNLNGKKFASLRRKMTRFLKKIKLTSLKWSKKNSSIIIWFPRKSATS